LANTLDIRRRIRSVRNTQQITKAMKVVAAAKLRRAQERIVAARPFAAALREVLSSVAARAQSAGHPLLQRREEHNVLLLVVTADKGLCGAFNTNVIKASQAALRDRGWQSVALIPIGRKGNDYFRRRAVEIRYQSVGVFQALSPDTARDIATVIMDQYTKEQADAVYAVYNEFKNVAQQVVRFDRLLPIQPRETKEPTVDYLYEPAPERILTELLPKYVEFQIYRILLESAAAEHGARMTAMESATRNASDMIDALTATYNRIRQASITREIIEIVSGAAALK
jgi:F-type H+-transporting ATPase subunit gamma